MFDKIEWVALRACIMIEQKNKCAMCGTIFIRKGMSGDTSLVRIKTARKFSFLSLFN